MDGLLGFLLVMAPFVLAIILLLGLRWKADTTGVLVWVVVAAIALVFFTTPFDTLFFASVAGVVDSFKITLMVGASIVMITYMQEAGALRRVVVFAKTLRGSHPAWQIMFLNLGFGCFLVSIGATPVSILPPIMLALGFSPLASVALPAVGYDPLTTYALLAIPAVVFQGEMGRLAEDNLIAAAPTLTEVGQAFSIYMPVISTGIALAMLYIAGGRKMLFNRESLAIAAISGVTAGVTAVVSNFLGVVTLTGVFAGIMVAVVLGVYAKFNGYTLLDRSDLTDEDKAVEQEMSLVRAASPWILLVIFSLLTNLIDPIFQFLFTDLPFPVTIGEYTVKLRLLWQAYTWVAVAVVTSFLFLPSGKEVLVSTAQKCRSRVFRPMISSAVFFAVAWILNKSSPDDLANNMVVVLSNFTSDYFGLIFPLLVPFIGLLGGFVSGSETSAIAMFTRYQTQTANTLGLDPITLGTANGIGGGLASVLTPAKVQNAAATIDQIGIEGDVIRKTIGISFLMTAVLAGLTWLWSKGLPTLDLTLVGAIVLVYLALMAGLFLLGRYANQHDPKLIITRQGPKEVVENDDQAPES